MSAPADGHLDRDGKLQKIKDLMLSIVPADGSSVGNAALRRQIESRLAVEGLSLSDDEYWHAHGALVDQGLLLRVRLRKGIPLEAGS